ncbi:unnamed protein product [Thelazia callipaeda]|uniref:CCHC-type domain-containing protein n=1 Tax=Thelazia callipaeda TaxID=103827 RepID=A0A0N5CP05_THECL|nr:unnamed protein product [Thelazia callipaeda]
MKKLDKVREKKGLECSTAFTGMYNSNISVAKKAQQMTIGVCRKCGYSGHLPFQCFNFLQNKKESFAEISSTSSESDYDTPLTVKEKKPKKKRKNKKHKYHKQYKKDKKLHRTSRKYKLDKKKE